MTKGIAIFLLPLTLMGCSEKPKDVAYYLKNEAERKEKLAECRPVSGALKTDQNCENATSAEREYRLEKLKILAMDMVRNKLKDPQSARFSRITYQKHTNVICGYVNAKNSYGGYIGDRRFVIVNGYVNILDGTSTVNEYFATMCSVE